MATLSGQATNESWQDFEQHLIDVGFLADRKHSHRLTAEEQERQRTMYRLAKMAYKQGYVAGSTATEVTYTPVHAIKTPSKKRYDNRSVRDSVKRSSDNETLQQILNDKGGPMPLSEIIVAMNKAGCTHWNNNNASGFIRLAMKDGCPIKKPSYGFYAFDWEAIR